ncbi:MAG TPA: hypothetical protein GX528_09800 [Firmicutes bacterium]|nr:hypothetical protein [Bacillota bacterium]
MTQTAETEKKKCPFCGAINLRAAIRCTSCEKDLTAPSLSGSWGKTAKSEAAKLPVKLLAAAWLSVLLTPFLIRSVFWYVVHWASLALGIALVRQNNRVAKINGWLVIGAFALFFILTVIVAPIMVSRGAAG